MINFAQQVANSLAQVRDFAHTGGDVSHIGVSRVALDLLNDDSEQGEMMAITRRDVLKGTLLLAGLSGVASLTSCSSAPRGGGSDGAGGMQVWNWPSGFSDPCMKRVQDKFPDYGIEQIIIGGDFKQKLTTTFAAKTGLPPITGIKGEDIAFFRAKPDYFVDLNTLGFDKIADEFLGWKVKQGQSVDGKQVGFPMDIGPTVMFYRHDIFEEAGLPSDPVELEPRVATWEEYFRLGEDLIKAKPGHYLIRNAGSVFSMSLAQQPYQFIDEDKNLIADADHVKKCWDLSVECLKRGIVAKIQSNTPDVQAMVNEGTLPADFGASWHLDDLQGDAPETAGKWHITQCPGGAGNIGGSFLAIPAGIDNPEKSFEVIAYMMDAEGQNIEYVEKGHFPSTHASLDSDALAGEVEFLGGQKAIEVLKPAAESVTEQFVDENNDAIGAPFFTELGQVEASGKDPQQAFDDAYESAKKLAGQFGVNVK